ncbi:hypothetical protein FQR65_LT02028 [Abscondita terminalis]|nr:hypothetical protein FQR65_LT02028 [Abscondita terminalis]
MSTESARILGIYPFPAYSHYQLGDAIFKKLAQKGHQVTVISPFKEENPPQNYTQILIDGMISKSKGMKTSLFDRSNRNLIENVYWLDAMGLQFTELMLEEPKVKQFLQELYHFDLVIFHYFMSEAYSGFCIRYHAPCVAVIPLTYVSIVNRHVGNYDPPSYISQLHVNYPADMNFFQRCFNTFAFIISEASHYLFLRPNQNKLLQKYFPNAPHLNDLYHNISLLLVNSHISIADVSPSLPNTIYIAGAHIRKPLPLPQDLQIVMDNATNGVILFSMGSNLKSNQLPEYKRNIILKIFSKLKQIVLWKWEDEHLPNKPDNVKISPWFPQQDILAHHNVVLFITHGGLMSTIEAVYNGIPVLGIPVFSDQGLNMARAESAGYGKYIFYDQLNENNFEILLKEMVTNSRFKENARNRAHIMKDQTVKPLDNAVFWIEYVMRHRGAPHLKSAALNLKCHYNLGNVIFKELAKRGHEVTVISSFKEKHIKNYKQILVDNLIEKGAEYSHYFYLRPNQKRILQKHFPNAPPLDDLFYNLSLILINTHVSVDDVAPYMPNLIPIAGAHIEGPNPLSVDLKKYLDDAKEGVIYFSMGSALKSVDIPKEKREAFLKVFSRLEQKVFWKWDDETLPHKSSNVFISPWFPQQDILVPILGIPLFADQGLNIARAEVAGYAKRIFYDDLNEDVLEITINEMLKNPRYKENAQKQSFILKDQVIPPLDNAIFWIEYVIRHKGAPHLKSAALNLSWYQYHLLDVTGFVFLILLFTLIGLKITFSLSWKSWFEKRNVEVTKKDQ